MNGWSIFTVILVVILIALVILFLILWLNAKGSKSNGVRDLGITDVVFSLPDANSINATWGAVGNIGDVVTLYASTSPINFNSNGVPEPGQNISASNSVPGGARTVTVTGLNKNTKYYVDLVVTNPNITGFNPTPDIIYTGVEVPASPFVITEINTRGGISLNTSDNTTVTYDTVVNKNLNDIWSYDPSDMTISTQGVGKFSRTQPALYNNNGVLSAADLSTLKSNPNFANIGQWVYSSSNNWCLKNNPSFCMNLTLPVTTNSPVTVISNSNSKWINVPSSVNLLI